MSNWQPIETAPKDGTTILTYPHYCITHWCDDLGGWWTWDDYRQADALVRHKPTHWMLLPDPPTETDPQ